MSPLTCSLMNCTNHQLAFVVRLSEPGSSWRHGRIAKAQKFALQFWIYNNLKLAHKCLSVELGYPSHLFYSDLGRCTSISANCSQCTGIASSALHISSVVPYFRLIPIREDVILENLKTKLYSFCFTLFYIPCIYWGYLCRLLPLLIPFCQGKLWMRQIIICWSWDRFE